MARKKTERQIAATVARVRRMEPVLDDCAAALARLRTGLESAAAVPAQLKALGAYYGGRAWRGDLEADEQGALPDDLKRGVLSEDAVYDAIADGRAVALQMLELAAAILKEV